jgi:hypothetical protein
LGIGSAATLFSNDSSASNEAASTFASAEIVENEAQSDDDSAESDVDSLLGDADSPYDMAALQADDSASPSDAAVAADADFITDEQLADDQSDAIATLLALGEEGNPSASEVTSLTAADLSDTDFPQHDLFDTDSSDAGLNGLFADSDTSNSLITPLTDLLSELIPEADL